MRQAERAQVIERGAERLRHLGCKLTPQREAMLAMLGDGPGHRTAAELACALDDGASSRATVYNNLELFERAGIVRRLVASDGQTYYDANLEAHHHGVCRDCRAIFDIALDPALAAAWLEAARGAGFAAESVSAWFDGRCTSCTGGEPR